MTINLSLGHTQRIIAAAQKAGLTIPQTAYVLATAFWETNRTMLPVEEAYYLGSKAEAYRRKLRYWPWYGRGFVQLTWKDNYVRASKETGADLIAAPGLAMDPDIAAQVLVIGSRDGWFTGKKLADYINSTRKDYKNARRIINGTDRAAEIAAIAEDYEAVLEQQSPKSALQDALKHLGLYTGEIDGIWGPKSQAALEAYKRTDANIKTLIEDLET